MISYEDDILDALVLLTESGCHLAVTWCLFHCRGNELADVAAKEETSVGQEGVSHHHNSAKANMTVHYRLPFDNDRLRRIYGERGEKVSHKLESLQLSRKYQVSVS